MVVVLGTQGKVAISKGTTWGTAASLGAGHRLPFRSTSFDGTPKALPDDTVPETAERNPHDNAETPCNGDIQNNLDYRQGLLLWAMLMGTAAAPTEIEAGVAYKHVLPWTADVQGKFFTYGRHNNVGASKAMKIASAKVNALRLSGAAGGRLMAVWDLLGAVLTRTDDPSSWAYTTDPMGGAARHVLFRRGTLRINAAAGGALGAGDKMDLCRGFELSVNRNLELDFNAALASIEPAPNGFADLSLRLDFFGCSAALFDLLRDACENRTLLKADYLFDSGVKIGASATNSYLFNLYAACLALPEEAKLPIDGPGRMPFSVTFNLHKFAGGAAPTGFPTGYDEALTVEIQNELATSILA